MDSGLEPIFRNRSSVLEDDECKLSKQTYIEPYWKSKKLKRHWCNGSNEETEPKPISINVLNDDTLIMVFSYLSLIDLIKLEQVSKRWRQIIMMSYGRFKKINIQKDVGKKFDVENLESILKRVGMFLIQLELPKFDSGDVSYCKGMFKTVNRYCKNLEHLKVDISLKSSKDLNGLSKHIAQNLKSLQVRNDKLLCDSALSIILKKTTNLEEFSITAPSLKGSSLSKLPKTCKTLSISTADSLRNGFLASALRKLPNLKNLHISFVEKVLPIALSPVSNQLVSLNIQEVEGLVGNSEFGRLSFPNLRILKISDRYSFWNDNILKNLIEKCPLLENLAFNMRGYDDDEAFRQIENLKHLICLDVSGTDIKAKTLLHLVSMSNNFQEIKCNGCKITGDQLLLLINCSPKLVCLKIGQCKKLESDFFESALKSVEERSNGTSLTIEISSGVSKYYHDNNERIEAKRLNLIKRNDGLVLSDRLKIKFCLYEYVIEEIDNFWYVSKSS